MNKLLIMIALLGFGCTPAGEVVDYSQYDDTIKQDLANKQQELVVLREIFRAQEHNDEEAFKFYLDEYMYIERLALTEEQKKHPKYKAWLTDEEIKSGVFMTAAYNYDQSH